MTHHHASHKFPILRNSQITRSGAQAYARAALKWKFGPSGPATAFWAVDGTVFRKKHHPTHQDPPPDNGSGGTKVPADSIQNDLEYIVPVTIGTPGVTLNLDFDTGSSDLWVFSSESPSASTKGHSIYNPSKSSTASLANGESWNISYGDGSSASGNVYKDVVKIGNISIQAQSVELAQKLSQQFVNDGSDGLLGLAWPSINTITPSPQPTPVENMISQKLISQALFTVKLDRGDDAGFYTFGQIDNSVTTDSIDYTPVDNSQGFWQFDSTSCVINGQTVERSGNTAIADTGTTLCLVSDDIITKIYSQIPGSKLDSSQGGYVYPSTTKIPTVSFAVGNKQITVNPADFHYGPADNGFYFGGIQSRGDLGFDILGDVWLKSAYVVFDQGNTQIGVAQRTD